MTTEWKSQVYSWSSMLQPTLILTTVIFSGHSYYDDELKMFSIVGPRITG